MLLVSINRAIPGASGYGTGDRHRFPRLLFFVYILIYFLNRPVRESAGLNCERIMSQNKTKVPGMEGVGSSFNPNHSSSSSFSNPYNKGTAVPGMNTGHAQTQGTTGFASLNTKPVVGFVYSISRQGVGEYWPLHVGANTIGSASNCDICLREATVSAEHAVLVVRKMKNPEKTIASIADARSTNGTMVNGESLGFSAVECINGDVITIGENYELVLLLIDTKALGLKVAENFMPMEETFVDEPHFGGGHAGTNPGEPPHFGGGSTGPWGSEYTNPNVGGFSDDGTVGFDGSKQKVKSGGTIGM